MGEVRRHWKPDAGRFWDRFSEAVAPEDAAQAVDDLVGSATTLSVMAS